MRLPLIASLLLLACSLASAQTGLKDEPDGPWMSTGWQRYYRKLIPEGVPLPTGAKPYYLPPASQNIATTNDVMTNEFHPASSGDENPNRNLFWSAPGGLAWVDKSRWRNVTWMYVPAGKKIRVWSEMVPILNSFGGYQTQMQWNWDFPAGTVLADQLINTTDAKKPRTFEVRMRTKLSNGKWDDGDRFAPDVDVDGEKAEYRYFDHTTPNLDDLGGVTGIWFKHYPKWKIKSPKFTLTRTVATGGISPAGYYGHGVSCRKCHEAQGNQQKYNGPTFRRKDTVMSWHPATQESVTGFPFPGPQVDTRWPLEIIGR